MDNRIITTLNHIEAHLSQVFNLNELAAIACLSASQFHRLFKRETGKTPFKFCQEIKLQSAFETITTGQTSIQDLSFELGYKDYETFSRAFKKQFQLAPGDLKSIAEKIRLEAKLPHLDAMFIATFEDNALTEANISELIKLTTDNNISAEDLKQAHIFTISNKDEKSLAENVIKNKFEITKDLKIWQKLIEVS